MTHFVRDDESDKSWNDGVPCCRLFGLPIASIPYYHITVTTISFKVSSDEAREIRARARRERLTVSEYLRRRAVAAVQPPSPIQRTRCPLTGATIFGGGVDLEPLSVESTREMLADFP